MDICNSVLSDINAVLDRIAELPPGRATGQVEYKLLEASLWLQTITPALPQDAALFPPDSPPADPSNGTTEVLSPAAPAIDTTPDPTADIPAVVSERPVIEASPESPTVDVLPDDIGSDDPQPDTEPRTDG